MTEFILGIDGGGSTTRVMVADANGAITQTALGDGINPLDKSTWRHTLLDLLRPYKSHSQLRAVAAGLPAYSEVAEISAAQSAVIAEIFGDIPQRLLNDVEAAQIGAFVDGPGILLLSGTGSMAWAADVDGSSYRTGGWGDVIGDEGSGYWIGRRILSLASQELDGRAPHLDIARALFRHLELDLADPANSLEGWVSRLTHARSEIAALALLATRLAVTGNPNAVAIIEEAADELARHVVAIGARVKSEMPWSYGGGSFSSTLLLDAVTRRIGRPPVTPQLPPIGGALLAAAKLADWPVDSAWIVRLGAALQKASGQTHHLPMTA